MTELKGVFWQLFVQYVVPTLGSALAMIGTWALAQLGKKLKAQAEMSKLAAMGAWVAHLGETVVADLEATLKPRLVEACKDGVLTPPEIAQLRQIALERLKTLAGQRGLHEIQRVMGIAAPELDRYLLGLIESLVSRLPASAVTLDAEVTTPGVPNPLTTTQVLPPPPVPGRR